MLAPPDAAVAARDPALPGLRIVLDPEAVADRLGVLLGPSLRAVPTYVRYKPGSSCLVGYRVEKAGQEHLAYVKAFGHGGLAKVAKMTSSEAAAAFPEDLVGAAIFPHDRLMPVISRLFDPVFLHSLLAKLFPHGPDVGAEHLQMLRYKPERRYVARLDHRGRAVAVVKAYCPDDYFRASKVAKVPIEGNGSPRTPRRLGASDRHRVVAREWLRGGSLDPASPTADMEEVGAALAKLHLRTRKHLRRRRRREEAADVRAAGGFLAWLVPGTAGRVKSQATRLAKRIREVERRKVPIHGDFSADQIVMGAFGVGVLDLDNAVLADPAADAGWFAADLELRVLEGTLSPHQAEAALTGLVTGYRIGGGEDLGERLPLYIAASMLRRAMEPFRYRSTQWPEQVESIVRRAEEVWSG